MPALNDRVTFCQNILSDTIRIVDHLDTHHQAPEEYYKWISYLTEFIERVTAQDPDLKVQMEIRGFTSLREFWQPRELQDFYDAITKGVQQIRFCTEYFRTKHPPESPATG